MYKCTKCGDSSVIIEKKASGQLLCKKCFIESTKNKVLRYTRKNKLIEKGDKVLVALSGGKDSVMVMNILNILRQRNIIELTAVTIDEGIKGYREEGVEIARENADKLGIKHRVVSFKEYFNKTLDEIMSEQSRTDSRHACTYCGVLRRWILNKVAQEEGATKLVTGHNLDDETQSILMNYLEGNLENLTRIGPISGSSYHKFIPKIKPLREIPEKEIGLYVVVSDLNVHFASCPYSSESFRGEVGSFIRQLSVNHPTIMYSTIRGFDKIKSILKKELPTIGVKSVCMQCGEPASGDLCKACSFSKNWK